ncbi:unknown transmembrane protein [Mesoplasma florum L1]|uniref:Uncharacterized protein n=2 Tax=Mesoplasma florum TaxID=2151 RepID=Q6F0K4_MESFL|nr:hypothetical protein [Mesoplasma florum]AAT75969.1 unknown transmembrane protein [Mesoplasma florum L1]AGY41722.1 unknown transmembrane protein [Mesoplasma florum W37]ATI74264.1 hypothetical protein CQZ70_03395 [Mesoplasma florum]AVN59218.1 hypothetical protein CG009_03275 [Mesoplasma florum]AVN59927.1 hypothetical protein CG008_03460 [Mesoplasma florum]
MNIIKRALSTIINGFLNGFTLGILPLVLWILNLPLVGQMIFKTPQAEGRGAALIYGLIYVLLCLSFVGIIFIIIWCLMGKQPLALQITNWLLKK